MNHKTSTPPLTTRRQFLKAAAAALAASQVGCSVLEEEEKGPGGIPTRPLGKTGERVPIICLGGWNIGVAGDDDAIAIMQEAVDEGLTFFDNCWDYHDGRSEELMGKALEGGRRDKVYLMTKVCARDHDGAMKHLEDSLRRLRTDRLDLWQFHGIQWKDDPELIFAANGALEAALEAKRAGKVRHIGFTGHKDPSFHQAMLAMPLEWDAVQMPLNILDAHYRSFQNTVLPACNDRKIGVIGMKSLGAQGGRIPKDLGIGADLLRRYVLSLPIATLVCGIETRENLRQDLAIARGFERLRLDEIAALLDEGKGPAADGQTEQYKVGNFGCDWHHLQAPRSSTPPSPSE